MRGSSTDRVAVFTVTVSPFTVKSPAIVTSFGRPIVIVPELSDTVVSFVVAENVMVPPKDTAVVEEPSETVIELFESLLFAMDPANIPFSIEVFAIVNAPESPAVASPDKAEKIYFLILVSSDFLFVPPAPSSTITKSASTRSAPTSVPPSMSRVVIAPSYAV